MEKRRSLQKGIRAMRRKNEKHLTWLRTEPCCVCGDNTSTEAAHVRMSDGRIGKGATGIAIKPDDCFTVPLCSRCHREQHSMSERVYWKRKNIDPVLLALALYAYSGDAEAAERIMRRENILAAG